MKSSPTPRDAEFLFHGAPYFGEPSTGCHRGFHGGKTSLQDVLCCVSVGVLLVLAGYAVEYGLRDARASVDNAAPLEIVKRYVQQQRGEASSPP